MALTDLKGVTKDDDANNSQGGFTGSIPHMNCELDPLDFLDNYNEKFKNADPILFREKPMTQLLATLIGKQKPNCLLLGQAGVGKTKLVEELARLIANDDPSIPPRLKKYTIYELQLCNLISDSSLVGELERKVKTVLEFASNPDNKAIVYIDEIHQLCKNDFSNDKIAQILKPALARGAFKCIGSTTLQEGTKLYSQPAFNRRYSKVIVEELTQNQTVAILKNILPSYVKHYSLQGAPAAFTMADEVLEAIPVIADQYASQGNHRPDNAITLLDNAIGNLIMARHNKVTSLQKIAGDTSTPQDAQNAQVALTGLLQNPMLNITSEQVKNQAVKIMKGTAARETVDFTELEQKLEVIQGQDHIKEDFLKYLRSEEKNLFPRKKPFTLLFNGPSGVGKTEMTKIIANHLTGRDPIILNMTEYVHSSSINQIIGSNMGYSGSNSSVELPFDCLESNPYQFILLDEFEKGHKSVQKLFMRVFDEGKLKTNRHQELDFSKAIIIATTNAGHSETRNLGFTSSQTQRKSQKVLVADLKKWFPTELINRFERIMTFNTLSADTFIDIINACYEREITRIRRSSRIKLSDTIDDATLERFKADYNQDFGARPAFNLVKDYIESQIT